MNADGHLWGMEGCHYIVTNVAAVPVCHGHKPMFLRGPHEACEVEVADAAVFTVRSEGMRVCLCVNRYSRELTCLFFITSLALASEGRG